MPAQLLDGNALSKKLRTEIAARGAIVTAKGTRPGLAVIVVGDNPASAVYVRNKVKACEDVGFHSVLERYSAELGEEELLARIDYSQASQRKITQSLLSKLTGRERHVLERIVAGRLNKQIADDLGISIKTVEAHRANIMEKLNVNTVADLLRLALSDPQPN